MTNEKNVREIVLDTETTGLFPGRGDRVVEIACVELINQMPTGKYYQTYVNPEYRMHPDATAISGITDDFLKDKPLFKDIMYGFLDFIRDTTLVIHNATFDIKFLNSELEKANKQLTIVNNVIDTLPIARKKYPGSPANLNALCRRFNIDLSKRDLHGALIDCYLLADVYVCLLGGKQKKISFSDVGNQNSIKNTQKIIEQTLVQRDFRASKSELEEHDRFLKTLNDAKWEKIYDNSGIV